MKDFKTMQEDYAKLVVKVGVNVQKGQPVVISASTEGVEFVRLLAKYAYEEGASQVHMNWRDDELTRMKYMNSPMEVFENYPQWQADMMLDFAKRDAAFISVHSDNPELLKDVDLKKISSWNKVSGVALKEYRKYTMNDINAWCVIAIPSKDWANKVYKDVDDEKAVEMLWSEIFKAVRADKEDPVAAWQDHIKNLTTKVEFLNSKRLKSLHYTSSNGTDLSVELPKGHIWSAAGGENVKGVYFVANMPTEEVYTMPHKDGVNGTVYSTKPLNYSGSLIDDFKITFKNGKVVDYEAKIGQEVLKDLLDIDDGAKHLGEVALVPYSSPISQANTVFIDTLYDENASCHFAFGKAYPTTIENGQNMTDEELEKAGVNNSLTHEDFMVGAKDLSIIGTTETGDTIQIFKNGEWAL